MHLAHVRAVGVGGQRHVDAVVDEGQRPGLPARRHQQPSLRSIHSSPRLVTGAGTAGFTSTAVHLLRTSVLGAASSWDVQLLEGCEEGLWGA